jgi:hypothetical protein
VSAGKQILVQQGFFSVWVSSTLHCHLASTFTPEPGARYVSSYQMNGQTRQCRMDIWRIGAGGERISEPSAVSVPACSQS